MMRSWRWLLAVMLGLSVVLAACAAEESDEEAAEQDDASDGEADGDADSDGEPEPDSDERAIDRDGTLRFGHVAPPTQWDPHRGVSKSLDYTYHTPVYDSLIEITPELELAPQLATEWEISDDGLTYTFTLREGVEFHDGEPFDAEAAVTNLERARDAEGALTQTQLANVESVEAVDEYTVQLDLAEADPTFLFTFAMEQAGRMASPAALEDPEALALEPVGTGPYRLDEARDDRAYYERVDGYWDEEVDSTAPQRLEIVAVGDDEARYRELETGGFDAVIVLNWRPELDDIIARDEFDLVTYESQRNHIMLVHHDRPGVGDPRVRRALNHAIDREGLQSLLGEESCQPTAAPFPEGAIGHAPEIDETYDYDPERARELLEEAGHPDLSLTAVAITVLPILNDVAVAVQGQLAEVGIDLEIEGITPAEMRSTWREGNHDAAIASAAGEPDPFLFYETWYIETDQPGTVPEDFNELVREANQHPLDSSERADGFAEAGRYLAEEDPIAVVLCRWPVNYVAADYVIGMDRQSFAHFTTSPATRYWGLLER